FTNHDLSGSGIALLLLAGPALIWFLCFLSIKNALDARQKPLLNLLSSSLNANAEIKITEAKDSKLFLEKAPNNYKSRKMLPAVSLILHLLPLILGAEAVIQLSNYVHEQAFKQWRDGNYAYSESLCRPAMFFADTFLAGNKAERAYSTYVLAECCRCQGKWQEAENLYKKAINLYDSNDIEMAAWAYDNLGRVYEGESKLIQAEENYNKAISLWKKSSSYQEPVIARALNRLSLLHAKMNLMEQAEAEAREVLERDRKVMKDYKIDNQILSADYNDLGVIQSLEGKAKEALASLEESLEIKKQAKKDSAYSYSEQMLREAISERNIAEVYKSMNNTSQAAARTVKANADIDAAAKSIQRADFPTRSMQKLRRYLLPTYEYPNCFKRSDISIQEMKTGFVDDSK
ncbi:MAG: tetratricopeptide repeat protein, partial [Candidatus Obscuribacterales bacterium]|nr:tetratricopeptide repeat protein [Candidatus Obscuribacterales bacterium]